MPPASVKPQPRSPSAETMALEPGNGLLPAVLGRFLAIARAVVGEEGMRRAVIDDEFGFLAGVAQGCLHLMHAVDRNAMVRGAVAAEYRRLHRGDRKSTRLNSSH